MRLKVTCLYFSLCFCSPLLFAGYAPEKADFALGFRNDVNPYRVLGLYVLPGEVVDFHIEKNSLASTFFVDDGSVVWLDATHWRWQAPADPGTKTITVVREKDHAAMILNVFILQPAKKVKAGQINGYRIGTYPTKINDPTDVYAPPAGFIEVTPANSDTFISPHFKLSQFTSKQAGSFPKYLTLRERLLLKLEHLLEALNDKGVRTSSFIIMSGFRTPFYNKVIGNVPFSRHTWGDAADIFIDESPHDGIMDDLNQDGKHDRHDAEWLYDFVEKISGHSQFLPFTGGLGAYGATASHGPFVHVDTRGFSAHWGR